MCAQSDTTQERIGITNLGSGNLLQDLPLFPMFYIHLRFEITSMHAYTAPLFHCYALFSWSLGFLHFIQGVILGKKCLIMVIVESRCRAVPTPPVPLNTKTSLEEDSALPATPASADPSVRAGCSSTTCGSAAAASRHTPRPTAAPHSRDMREEAVRSGVRACISLARPCVCPPSGAGTSDRLRPGAARARGPSTPLQPSGNGR
jgi:hypothetical protein